MSQLNEFDNFNFSGFSGAGSDTQANEDPEEKRNEKRDLRNDIVNTDFNTFSNFEDNSGDNFGEKENGAFQQDDQNFSSHLIDNKMNDTLSNLYRDVYINREYGGENLNSDNFNKESSNNSNRVKDDSYNNNDLNVRGMDSKTSFENSGEPFFDKDSDIVESDEANVWEIERLKRIEERKEYEIKMRKEIKEKAAEDLKKWYEEMAVKIEERKNIFNQQRLEEEKKREENLENKTWVKVSQYLDFEKGEYFKEDSRIKQILLKLIKQENS